MTSATPKASGVLMLDLLGTTLSEEERELLQEPQVGGVILFTRNYVDLLQLQRLIVDIRASQPDILIAVDQEGGRVQRLREGFTRIPPMNHFQNCKAPEGSDQTQYQLQLLEDCGWLMAAEVLACDIDFSFAPVLDLETGLSEVIGNRAFSADPERVIELASAFMRGMHSAGMATTGKHFPGHGNVSADSHTDIPVDTRSLNDIREQDLIPFAKCIPALDAVMPAHVIYTDVDETCAGFSTVWLQQILRQELGFNGVIFSDDLSMAGAAAAGSLPDRIDAALGAGCDMILVCNDRPAALQALVHLKAIKQAPNTRLPAMRMRRHWSRQQLAESARWQSISSRLTALQIA